MSNAMRMGKRTLAGVAAGALAAGMVSFVGASTASAAQATGTASPVRPGALGTIPAAVVTFAGVDAPSLADDDSLVLDLITAPTTGIMALDDSSGSLSGLTYDDTATLTKNAYIVGANTGGFFGADSNDDSFFSIAIDGPAGLYVGQLGNGDDSVDFTVNTTGAPASMTLTPASQTVQTGAVASLAVTLLDANSNVTQPLITDRVTLSSNSDDTVVASKTATSALTSVSGSAWRLGVKDIYLQTFGHPAGTTTVSAQPAGSLPSFVGTTAQTATVTKSGTIATNSIADMTVTTPSDAINAGTAPSALTAQIPSPTTSFVVTIDDTTVASAGNVVRLAAVTDRGTVNGKTSDDTAYVDVTTDASKQGTATFALGGTAAVDGAVITIKQVNVLGAPTTVGGAAKLTVSVKTPTVQANSIVPTPSGEIVAKVGATTPVTVQVDDSFGSPASGWLVTVTRTSAAGTVVSTGTTDSAGSASVEVKPLSTTKDGMSETYYFTATNPLTAASTVSSKTLKVNYSTSGDISSMTIAPNAAASFSNTSSTQTTLPVVLTPSSGTVAATASTGIYTVSSAKVTTAPSSSVLSFTVLTSPQNAVTVTAPEGVKVSATQPTAGETLWSAGSQTATITGDNTGKVWVWATKTGTHELTFTSGTIEVKGKIVVANKASDAYNIALTPDKQSIGAGSIGTVTLSVTDVFGNGVATGSADDSGPVTITASGEVLLAGYKPSDTYTTGTDGTATVTVIAGNSAGFGTLAAAPKSGSTTPAWVTGYTPPTGAPAPVTSAAAEVTVTSSATKSITITGSRGTVKKKPGVMVDGLTTGFAEGDKMVPHIKFPGQTEYSEGTSRPQVDADGEFYWQRKTGKKIYIYFSNESGDVRSTRIIIQAK